MAVPLLFRCPISLELFKDPVTLCTGQTYDRFCIEKWLAAGNSTCPVTMQKLSDLSMVPNLTLSHLIHQWLQSSCRTGQDCTELADNDLSFAVMRQTLESDESTLENKLKALEKVHDTFQEQPFRNSCLIRLDFFGLLFGLVLQNAHSQESRILLEKALFCAVKLMPFSDVGALNILQKESHFNEFLVLLEKGSVPIKKSLCLLVEAICSSPETQNLAEKIGASAEFSKELLHLVEDSSETAEAGITAISALSAIKQNRENLAKNGAVERLVSYIPNIKNHSETVTTRTTATIENLLSTDSAKGILINHPHGINSLVKMVFRVSNHEGSESAVNSLLIICCESNAAREKAISQGVLTQLLLLLQSQCSARTKTKARKLLKLLRSMRNEDRNHHLP